MGCGVGLSRFFLILFNFIFWLSGAAILGVGIWILVDPDIEDYQKVIEDASTDGDFLEVGAYILIAFGALVFLVGFCGCCGAIRKSRCLLGIYILCLIIVCAGELAAGIYVAVRRGEVEDDLDEKLSTSFKEHFETLKGPWDVVQSKMDCCGPNGPKDYENITWTGKGNNKIPDSCCVTPDNPTQCQTEAFTQGSEHVRQNGCTEELKEWVKDNAGYVMGVGIGIAVLQVLGLICAIFFCRNMDKGHSS